MQSGLRLPVTAIHISSIPVARSRSPVASLFTTKNTKPAPASGPGFHKGRKVVPVLPVQLIQPIQLIELPPPTTHREPRP